MLEVQFLLVNVHFTLNLLVTLVYFAVAWLYFDAWQGRKDFREGSKCFGFFLLSLSFLVHSTAIEQSLLEQPLLGPETINLLTATFKIAGYITYREERIGIDIAMTFAGGLSISKAQPHIMCRCSWIVRGWEAILIILTHLRNPKI